MEIFLELSCLSSLRCFFYRYSFNTASIASWLTSSLKVMESLPVHGPFSGRTKTIVFHLPKLRCAHLRQWHTAPICRSGQPNGRYWIGRCATRFFTSDYAFGGGEIRLRKTFRRQGLPPLRNAPVVHKSDE